MCRRVLHDWVFGSSALRRRILLAASQPAGYRAERAFTAVEHVMHARPCSRLLGLQTSERIGDQPKSWQRAGSERGRGIPGEISVHDARAAKTLGRAVAI